MGQYASAKEDYRIAQGKIARYRAMTADSAGRAAFADTTRKYDRLLALDSDFARRDFNDELLQNSNVSINLKPLFRFVVQRSTDEEELPAILNGRFEDKRMNDFEASIPVGVELSCRQAGAGIGGQRKASGCSGTGGPQGRGRPCTLCEGSPRK